MPEEGTPDAKGAVCIGPGNDKLLVGRFPGVPGEGVPNKKVLVVGYPDFTDVGVPSVKELLCLDPANEKVTAAEFEDFPEASVTEGKEVDCLVLENEKEPGEDIADDGAVEKKSDVEVCEKTPLGRSPEVPEVDETLPLRTEPGNEERITFTEW